METNAPSVHQETILLLTKVHVPRPPTEFLDATTKLVRLNVINAPMDGHSIPFKTYVSIRVTLNSTTDVPMNKS
jgi:hypothetical protein